MSIPLKELAFQFGDVVWHKTNGDVPGVVVGVIQRPGHLLYEVTWQDRSTCDHYSCELTDERPKYSAADPDPAIP